MCDAAPELKIALTQWHAGRDGERNLETALGIIADSAAAGADLVLLPENGLFLGTNAEMRAAALSTDAPQIRALQSAAAKAGAAVVMGGFKHKLASGIIRNTALVIDRHGGIAGGYDKIHLFDANVGGQAFRASEVEARGTEPVLLELKGVLVGLTICYDLRFPELYRRLALAGASVILIPSAFTQTTGEAHWEVLLRARAIESSAYVIASATVKGADGTDAFATYGHALAVDPWGAVMADLGVSQRDWKLIAIATEKVAKIRNSLPVLKGVQFEACARSPVVLGLDSA